MAEATGIEWCDSTFNGWVGCTKVGPGCDNCYASVSTPARTMGIVWGAGQPRRRTSPSNWALPLRWERQHEAFAATNGGRRRSVFCSSLADVFDNEVPTEWRDDLFTLIEATPHLNWLVLTKRIGNVKPMLHEMERVLPPNVWLGITVVNQDEADRDIPKLVRLPATVRWLSMEPLLDDVDLSGQHLPIEPDRDGTWRYKSKFQETPQIDWVIVGGESGAQARPMHPGWARNIRDQCAAAGVPFLFKQNGEFVSVSEVAGEGAHFTFADGTTVRKVGKKLAGRTLDGAVHNGYPEVPHV